MPQYTSETTQPATHPGSVTGRNRQELVDNFNKHDSCFVLLVSTAAGGVGLNLTAANKVVVFDPSWDPSHDLQVGVTVTALLVAAASVECGVRQPAVFLSTHCTLSVE